MFIRAEHGGGLLHASEQGLVHTDKQEGGVMVYS